MAYDLHIVRTKDWTMAADKPVTKQDVDALIGSDGELKWSTTDYVDMKGATGAVTRYWMIAWRGQPCFWWYRDQIQCSDPDHAQQAKLVGMADALDALVMGDDGEEYPLATMEASVAASPNAPRKQPWPLWKQLVVAFLIGCVLLGLKVLIFGG